jgi:hypothetical protein
MQYMEKLVAGSQKVKTELCFNMIDNKKKGYFTSEDLAELIRSIITTNEVAGADPAKINMKVER